MKQILLLLIFNVLLCSLLAQEIVTVEPKELNELISEIQEHSKKDSTRVRLLSKYANLCFYDLDFLRGFQATNEARDIAQKINYGRGEGLYLKSISIFRKRIHEGNIQLNNPIHSRVILGNEFFNNFDIYYETAGNSILEQYTDFDIFGNIRMPKGSRDGEIEHLRSSVEEALNYYTTTDDLVTIAYLNEALYFIKDNDKSKEHKEIAKRSYQELSLSYHQILLLVHDIDDLLSEGLEDAAKPLEIEAVDIYSKEQDKYIKAHCAFLLSRTYGMHNRANLQLEYLFLAEELLSEIEEKDLMKAIYSSIASTYEWYLTDSEKALEYEYKELNLRKEIGYYERIAYTYLLISESLFGLKKIRDFPPEYKDYLKPGAIEGSLFFDAELLWAKGRMLRSQGKREAQSSFLESIETYMKYNDRNGASWAALDLAESYKSFAELDNAIKYAQMSFDWASEINLLNRQLAASDFLSQLYEEVGQQNKAFIYLKKYKSFKNEHDKLNNAAQRSELEMQSILRKRQREIEILESQRQLKEQENKTQRIWLFSIAGALASLLLLTFILVRNNQQKKESNKDLASALNNLKSTQAQLIQSEKMASLGELTAGIAHEIQNPLNFVNNFSEVSKEMIQEMREEIQSGDYEEVGSISQELEQNLEKIHHHGKRADSIVKGMLMHSSANKGEKMATDINALCEEFLRLSYHGLSAKDRTFNADFEMDFDVSIPKIEVVPQDIGRVLLNVFNNAFQACTEKSLQGLGALEGVVKVSTKNLGDKIEISVTDNGPGIPDDIKDKIFQPFFTTKPTGQGTGLGLSLAYDIVKAHGGDISVNSQSDDNTVFTIKIPVDQ